MAVNKKRSRTKSKKRGMEWQTGKYARHQQFTFRLSYNFLMLCALWQVPPQTVLLDFMDNISSGSWQREGRDKAKEHLAQYIIAMGYGQQFYTPADIVTMFKELDAEGMLFPQATDMELLDAYVAWRDLHSAAWFNNWFSKVRRNINDIHTTNL
jgi:hypothetical protein